MRINFKRRRYFPSEHKRNNEDKLFCQNALCPMTGTEFPKEMMIKVGEFYFHDVECGMKFKKIFGIVKD